TADGAGLAMPGLLPDGRGAGMAREQTDRPGPWENCAVHRSSRRAHNVSCGTSHHNWPLVQLCDACAASYAAATFMPRGEPMPLRILLLLLSLFHATMAAA